MDRAQVAARVFVLGSANQDLVLQVDSLPLAGETVLATSSSWTAGGKGANQAVAASVAGAPTRFLGVVGNDSQGDFLLDALQTAGVDVRGVRRGGEVNTGIAVVMVSRAGDNSIVVLAGANALLTGDLVLEELAGLRPGDVLVVQCEIAPAAAEAAIRLGAERGARVILNWAPYVPLTSGVPGLASVVVVNESEGRAVLADALGPTSHSTTDFSAERIARALGCDVIVTRGSEGSELFSHREGPHWVPALRVDEVVDSTGAGDAYVGCLAAHLALGAALPEAMQAATAAAAAAVQHSGAQSPGPHHGHLAVPQL